MYGHLFSSSSSFRGGAGRGEGGGGGNLYNGLTGQAPPERGTFFMLHVYKWVGIFSSV